MSTRLVASAFIAAALIVGPGWFGPRNARAATIQELVDNNGGMITVGPFKFTFDANSVTGDRTAAQVIVNPVDSNGLEFQLNPGFMLLSNMTGAQTMTVGITYTVMANSPIVGAGMNANVFAQNTANGASSGVTTTYSDQNGTMLYKGTPPPATVMAASFPDMPMTLTVMNQGRVHVPVRGAGGSADEAQLNSITNTFVIVPEPATLGLMFAGGVLHVALRRGRTRRHVRRLDGERGHSDSFRSRTSE